ncbi:hypothetical protein CJ184_001440 [Actinotignum urinale]|uniref:Uncharacterized protein n=1 Tax=Actinotignum urinale TaxID=190146 RepID=A0AAW9HYL6_9ACTO|nr:hypothetical protein [Actinotignum urinale]MDY5129682.1 hypothetical protein [Actinotignum urinale]MDY5155517.1 hypothetical protein [Actinotignum urinale]WIK59340.1 hypothetical protein CJ184_001440 [Actinotignum urinale]
MAEYVSIAVNISGSGAVKTVTGVDSLSHAGEPTQSARENNLSVKNLHIPM